LLQSAVRSAVFSLLIALIAGPTAAFAQSVGPDEIVNAGKSRQLALTEAQKSAIYKAVLANHARRTASGPNAVPAAIGARVSPAAELAALPDQADAGSDLDLKYAMVEGDLIVVDPVGMRVIDVIHGSAIP
jgi:hypothetical protein